MDCTSCSYNTLAIDIANSGTMHSLQVPTHKAQVKSAQLNSALRVQGLRTRWSASHHAPYTQLSVAAASSSHTVFSRRTASALIGMVASPVVMAASASSGSKDLLIFGPGVLGAYAGKLWKDANPDANVVGLTNSTTNHARLTKVGVTGATRDTLAAGIKFPYVLYCAPPSGSPDYPADVAAAAARWDSSAPGASMVFTSSMSVCSVDDGSTVTEDCPLVPLGGPQDKLLLAEKATLEAGGNVVRLVGLYHAQRGAHTYFLKVGQVPRPGDNVVNLLHYEDAARLAVAVLAGQGQGPYHSRVFLGCDNHPVSFRDMMDACTSSGVFQGSVTFLQPDAGPKKSKRTDNSATRATLGGWSPTYESFASFMKAGGKDWYNTSGVF